MEKKMNKTIIELNNATDQDVAKFIEQMKKEKPILVTNCKITMYKIINGERFKVVQKLEKEE